MENPFADIVENQIRTFVSRLPFDELCGFYAALMDGVTNSIVAAASNLGEPTVSNLRHAGEARQGQMRYPKVAQTYRALGREAFIHKYVTPQIKDRLRVARDQVVNQRSIPKPLNGVNPRASKYAGIRLIADPNDGMETYVEIAFDRGVKPGWKWREIPPTADSLVERGWRGDPQRDWRGFPTSKDAYDLCRLRFAPTREEMLSGVFEARTTEPLDLPSQTDIKIPQNSSK